MDLQYKSYISRKITNKGLSIPDKIALQIGQGFQGSSSTFPSKPNWYIPIKTKLDPPPLNMRRWMMAACLSQAVMRKGITFQDPTLIWIKKEKVLR